MSGLLDGFPELLKAEDVQEALNIGRTLAYQAMRDGTLPVVKIGRAVRVPKPALERWIERQTVRNGEAPAGTEASTDDAMESRHELAETE